MPRPTNLATPILTTPKKMATCDIYHRRYSQIIKQSL